MRLLLVQPALLIEEAPNEGDVTPESNKILIGFMVVICAALAPAAASAASQLRPAKNL